jgi:hypothetical protein
VPANVTAPCTRSRRPPEANSTAPSAGVGVVAVICAVTLIVLRVLVVPSAAA